MSDPSLPAPISDAHHRPAEEVVAALDTDPQAELRSAEAVERRARFGGVPARSVRVGSRCVLAGYLLVFAVPGAAVPPALGLLSFRAAFDPD